MWKKKMIEGKEINDEGMMVDLTKWRNDWDKKYRNQETKPILNIGEAFFSKFINMEYSFYIRLQIMDMEH